MKLQLKPTAIELGAIVSIAASAYIWTSRYNDTPALLRTITGLITTILLGIALFAALKAYAKNDTIRLIPLLIIILFVALIVMVILFVAYFLIELKRCAITYGSC